MAGNNTITYRLDFRANLTNVQQQLDTLKAKLMDVSKMRVINPNSTAEIRQASNAATALQQSLQRAFNANTGKLDLTKFNLDLKNSGHNLQTLSAQLLQAGQKGQEAFMQMSIAIANSQKSMLHLTGVADRLWTTLKNTARWQISSYALTGLISGISNALNYIKDLNKSLNDIRIVSGDSASEMERYAKAANQAARALGSTTLDVTNATLIYRQQGNALAEAAKKAEITVKAANVATEASAEEMSSYLTAIWNSYKVGADELEIYADKLSKVGAITAVNMSELATALEKVAATANTVGVSYDQLLATIATVGSITRLSAETIGTAFKTIYARIGDLKIDKEVVDEDGIKITLGEVSSSLKAVGINVLDMNDNMKDMGSIIENIGGKWQNMTEAEKQAVAQVIAGKRQYTHVMALFENWDYYKDVLLETADAQGTLNEQNRIFAESMEAAGNRVSVAWQKVMQNLNVENGLVDFINGFGNVIDKVGDVVKAMGGFKSILLGIGIIVTKVFTQQISNGLVGIASGFMSLIGVSDKFNAKILQDQRKQIDSIEGVSAEYKKELSLIYRLTEAQNTFNATKNKMNSANSFKMDFDLNILNEEIQLAITSLNEFTQKRNEMVNGKITMDFFNEAEFEVTENDLREINRILTETGGDIEKIRAATENSTVGVIEGLNYVESELIETDKQIEDAKADMDSLGKTAEGFVNKMRGLPESGKSFKELKKELQETKNNLDIAKQSYDKFFNQPPQNNSETFNLFQQALRKTGGDLEKAKTQYETLKSTMSNGSSFMNAKNALNYYMEKLQLSNMSQEDFQKILNETGGNVEKLKQKLQQIKAELDGVSKKEKNISFKNLGSGSEAITKVTSGMMSLGMAITQVDSLVKTLSDDTVSNGEKMTQILVSLPMLVMSLNGAVTVFKDLGLKTATAWGWVAGIAIALIGIKYAIDYFDKINVTAEEAKENLKELNSEFETLSKELKDIKKKQKDVNEVLEEYKDLKEKATAGYLTEEDKERLVSLSEELVDNYGLQSSGLDSLTNSYNITTEAINSYIEALEAERKAKAGEIKDNNREQVRNRDILIEDVKNLEKEYGGPKEPKGTNILKMIDKLKTTHDDSLSVEEALRQSDLTDAESDLMLEAMEEVFDISGQDSYNIKVENLLYEGTEKRIELFDKMSELVEEKNIKIQEEIESFYKENANSAVSDLGNILPEESWGLLSGSISTFLNSEEGYLKDEKAYNEYIKKTEGFLNDKKELLNKVAKEIQEDQELILSGEATTSDYGEYYNALADKINVFEEAKAKVKGVISDKEYQSELEKIRDTIDKNIALTMESIKKMEDFEPKDLTYFNNLEESFINLQNRLRDGSIDSVQYFRDIETTINNMDFDRAFGDNKEAATAFFDSISENATEMINQLRSKMQAGEINLNSYISQVSKISESYATIAKKASETFKSFGKDTEEIKIGNNLEEFSNKLKEVSEEIESIRQAMLKLGETSVDFTDLQQVVSDLGITVEDLENASKKGNIYWEVSDDATDGIKDSIDDTTEALNKSSNATKLVQTAVATKMDQALKEQMQYTNAIEGTLDYSIKNLKMEMVPKGSGYIISTTQSGATVSKGQTVQYLKDVGAWKNDNIKYTGNNYNAFIDALTATANGGKLSYEDQIRIAIRNSSLGTEGKMNEDYAIKYWKANNNKSDDPIIEAMKSALAPVWTAMKYGDKYKVTGNSMTNVLNLNSTAEDIQNSNVLTEEQQKAVEESVKAYEELVELKDSLKEKNKELAEAWEEEYLARLERDLEKHQLILDEYKQQIETLDWFESFLPEGGISQIQNDIDQFTLIKQQVEKAQAEYNRLKAIQPKNAEEARVIYDQMSSLNDTIKDGTLKMFEMSEDLKNIEFNILNNITKTYSADIEAEFKHIKTLTDSILNDTDLDKEYEAILSKRMTPIQARKDIKNAEDKKEKEAKKILEIQQETDEELLEMNEDYLEKKYSEESKERAENRSNIQKEINSLNKQIKEKQKTLLDEIQSMSQTQIDSITTYYEGKSEQICGFFKKIKEVQEDTSLPENKKKEYKIIVENIDSQGGGNEKFPSLDNISQKGTYPYNTSKYKNTQITANFRDKGKYWDADGHDGTDFGLPGGAELLAVTDGEVVKVQERNKAYGSTIIIQDKNGYRIRYAHMKNDLSIKVGTQVKKGDIVGRVGVYGSDYLGNASGSHLHLEVANPNGEKIDPLSYISKYAEGTDSHPGGLAMVGDERPGAYEAIITPDGEVSIAGKNNAEIVDLPKGTQVLSHKDTKKFLKSIPKYKNGTISFQKASEQTTRIGASGEELVVVEGADGKTKVYLVDSSGKIKNSFNGKEDKAAAQKNLDSKVGTQRQTTVMLMDSTSIASTKAANKKNANETDEEYEKRIAGIFNNIMDNIYNDVVQSPYIAGQMKIQDMVNNGTLKEGSQKFLELSTANARNFANNAKAYAVGLSEQANNMLMEAINNGTATKETYEEYEKLMDQAENIAKQGADALDAANKALYDLLTKDIKTDPKGTYALVRSTFKDVEDGKKYIEEARNEYIKSLQDNNKDWIRFNNEASKETKKEIDAIDEVIEGLGTEPTKKLIDALKEKGTKLTEYGNELNTELGNEKNQFMGSIYNFFSSIAPDLEETIGFGEGGINEFVTNAYKWFDTEGNQSEEFINFLSTKSENDREIWIQLWNILQPIYKDIGETENQIKENNKVKNENTVKTIKATAKNSYEAYIGISKAFKDVEGGQVYIEEAKNEYLQFLQDETKDWIRFNKEASETKKKEIDKIDEAIDILESDEYGSVKLKGKYAEKGTKLSEYYSGLQTRQNKEKSQYMGMMYKFKNEFFKDLDVGLAFDKRGFDGFVADSYKWFDSEGEKSEFFKNFIANMSQNDQTIFNNLWDQLKHYYDAQKDTEELLEETEDDIDENNVNLIKASSRTSEEAYNRIKNTEFKDPLKKQSAVNEAYREYLDEWEEDNNKLVDYANKKIDNATDKAEKLQKKVDKANPSKMTYDTIGGLIKDSQEGNLNTLGVIATEKSKNTTNLQNTANKLRNYFFDGTYEYVFGTGKGQYNIFNNDKDRTINLNEFLKMYNKDGSISELGETIINRMNKDDGAKFRSWLISQSSLVSQYYNLDDQLETGWDTLEDLDNQAMENFLNGVEETKDIRNEVIENKYDIYEKTGDFSAKDVIDERTKTIADNKGLINYYLGQGHRENSPEIRALEKENKDIAKEIIGDFEKEYSNDIRKIDLSIDEELSKENRGLEVNYDYLIEQTGDKITKTGEMIQTLLNMDYKWESEMVQNYVSSMRSNMDSLYDYQKQRYENALSQTKEVRDQISYVNNKEIESLDRRIQKINDVITLEEKHNANMKELRDMQYEINQELISSKNNTQWLDKETRDLLFNQEDYYKISSKISENQAYLSELYVTYQEKLTSLGDYELDQANLITEQYEAQVAAKKEELEILKASLTIADKQNALNTALSERNVRIFAGGRWQQVANAENVNSAYQDLQEAIHEKTELEISNQENEKIREQKEVITNLELLKDSYQNQIEMMDDAIEELEHNWQVANSTIKNLNTVTFADFKAGMTSVNGLIGNVFDSLDAYKNTYLNEDYIKSLYGDLGSTANVKPVATKFNAPTSYANMDYHQAMLEATSLEQLISLGAARDQKIKDQGITGVQSTDSIIKEVSNKKGWSKNASGTRDARGGISQINELGIELLATNSGQFIELNPHEKIFNNDQMNFLYDFSRKGIESAARTISSVNITNDESMNIENVTLQLPNVKDTDSFIDGLKNLKDYIRNTKTIK